MNSRRLCRLVIPAIALALGVGSVARAADPPEHTPKVSLADARAKALAVVAGSVRAEELEHEGGRWIYSFEIRPNGEKRNIIREVNIDADTGAIVNVETEKD